MELEHFMRTLTAIALTAALATSVFAQEPKKVPKDSMRVTVPGCTRGYVFTAGPKTEDQVGRAAVPEGIHLRMNGPKKMINDIKAHEGSMIEVTGLMKKGQYNGTGVNVGGGVHVTGGAPVAGSGGPGVGVLVGGDNINYIDVEAWRPIAGDCR
jgi:hypothetical protein